MKEILKRFLEKVACHHEWEIKASTAYTNHDQHLLVCTKCGKIKRVRV